jgi:hypothetical protein
MQLINLPANNPNFSFNVILNGNIYDITIKDCGGFCFISIDKNSEALITSKLAIAYQRLIDNNEKDGDFVFITTDWQYPQSADFLTKCNLYYIEQGEDIPNGNA